MSKPINNLEKVQVAGYGLHYYANNQLIQNVSDRQLFQCLLDIVRKQLSNSLDDQTIIMSKRQLGRIAGLDIKKTIPSSLKRLEAIGLIKQYKNGITILCDKYVAIVQHYESLSSESKGEFADKFSSIGTGVIEECNITVKENCRCELTDASGSSILVQGWKNTPFLSSEVENGGKLHPFQVQKPEMVESYTPTENNDEKRWKVTPFSGSDGENGGKLHLFDNQKSDEGVTLHLLSQDIAQMVQVCTANRPFEEFENVLDGVLLHPEVLNAIKVAHETGKFPENSVFDPQKKVYFSTPNGVLLHLLAQKMVYFSTPVIIYNNKIYNKGASPQKKEVKEDQDTDNFQDNLKKGFEGFEKVEVVNFDEPSEDIEEQENEINELSQQRLKRAERSLRDKNSYRNKPFKKVEKVKDIVECLDEVVKSPVDFFIYQFWWGVFDLYCDHYRPSTKINEEGELEEDPQSFDWKEMIGASLPQDEIYSLAQNVYEDLVGAVQKGEYVYGDDNEWKVRFAFKEFEDFNPYEIFQWSPCTMQDRSIPALKVAIDRFYDIEADDVEIPRQSDKRIRNSQNKEMINLILSADDSKLSPLESSIKLFYHDFVISGEDNIINEFTDGKGTPLESGGGLPDHLLKPWCYNLPSIGYNELTGALNSQYRPCDGIHKKAYIFSSEKVAEWNEKNGYKDSLAMQALQK